MKLPLDGIKVVDLTRILSGPFCTMMLGDMGADVVKIEDPKQGDPIRQQGTIVNDLSWYFASFNRNKRSLTLDLRSADGQHLLRQLLARADVLVENFKPGVLDKMGLDAATLHTLNPRLIVASINGYGSSGPYKERPAFDFVIQAMSGFMSVNGLPGGEAMRSAPPITDLVGGLYAAFGVVNALRARDLNGTAQRVDASMMDGIMSMFAYLASDHLATGAEPVRTGNDHPITSPYGLFHTADGDIAIAPSTEVILTRLLQAVGLPDLRDDPRFATNALRMVNRDALNVMINDRLADDTQENWVRRLNAVGVPCGVVQNLQQVFSNEQVRHQNMVMDVEHPGHGTVRMLGFPVKLSDTPCQVRYPAPAHGAHTAQVLQEWGIVPEQTTP